MLRHPQGEMVTAQTAAGGEYQIAGKPWAPGLCVFILNPSTPGAGCVEIEALDVGGETKCQATSCGSQGEMPTVECPPGSRGAFRWHQGCA